MKEERVAVPCTLCGSSEAAFLWESHDHRMKTPERYQRCLACQAVYVSPRLSDAALQAFYEEFYAETEEVDRDDGMERKVLKRLARLVPDRKLLDVGCGEGFFLSKAREQGFEPYGTEISAHAAATARQRFGLLSVHVGPLAEAPWDDGFFDAVSLLNVIEHLTSPPQELGHIRRMLKPGGVLVVRTPNLESVMARLLKNRWYHCICEHLTVFTPSTLSRFLDRMGFDVVETHHDFTLGSLGEAITLGYWKYRYQIGSALRKQRGPRAWPRLGKLVAALYVVGWLHYLGAKVGRGEFVVALARKRG